VWEDFSDTVLHFETNPPFSFDLRHALSENSRALFRGIDFERSFGIMTAEDPMGVQQGQTVNSERTSNLRKELSKLGCSYVWLDACSPDRSHCERSVALALDLETVAGIARRYDQLAVFWFDGSAFWIIPVCSDNAALKLPARK
jgi:hypothetical protein